jgi:cyclopropane-fatty-acyl-phospholipid synthase
MGCGWGPFLKYLQEIGAEGIGLTLSTGQHKACVKNGLNVHLLDCRAATADTFGIFDAVTCIGAFEAFCSREEWKAGSQDEVYRTFFRMVRDLLPAGGRYYMQTMTFGKNMIDYQNVDIHAERNSDAHICALVEKQFPGHWLPSSVDQIIEDAKPHFKLIDMSNGRLDYIETQKQWRKRFRAFSLRKCLFYLSLVPEYLTNKELRQRLGLYGTSANRLCFERQIIDHFRLVFEKVERTGVENSPR